MRFRRLLLVLLALFFSGVPSAAAEGDWALLGQPRAIVLFRHATAPGTGDPAGFALGDCATQRNLNEQGRTQARAIGEGFRTRGVVVGRVLSSQWCRAVETAQLAFPGRVEQAPAFNSFFANAAARPKTTARALDTLARWTGPGVLVVVTHQVNITALTGIAPSDGAGVIVRMQDAVPTVIGRLPPPVVD